MPSYQLHKPHVVMTHTNEVKKAPIFRLFMHQTFFPFCLNIERMPIKRAPHHVNDMAYDNDMRSGDKKRKALCKEGSDEERPKVCYMGD